MPIIISNNKSWKKDIKKHEFNICYKKQMKKKIKIALEKNDVASIHKCLDVQLSKGLFKKNKCNRLKSKYISKINSNLKNT